MQNQEKTKAGPGQGMVKGRTRAEQDQGSTGLAKCRGGPLQGRTKSQARENTGLWTWQGQGRGGQCRVRTISWTE